jgi:hypothetical protein
MQAFNAEERSWAMWERLVEFGFVASRMREIER